VAAAVRGTDAYAVIERLLDAGKDAALGVAPLARPAVVAARYLSSPQQVLVIAESPGAAEKFHLQLGAFLPIEANLLLPDRADLPFGGIAPDLRSVAERARALYYLEAGVPVAVVTSIHALMRYVPPRGAGVWDPLMFRPGQDRGLEGIVERLVEMGYVREAQATEEGTFALRGDTLDVHPPLGTQAVRVEFFGDEVESVKRLAPQTSQTLGEVPSAEVFPIRELRLTAVVAAEAARKMRAAASGDEQVAYHAGLVEERISFGEIERYLPEMYPKLATVASYISPKGVVAVSEPRALFDAALRRFEELDVLADKAEQRATKERASTFGLTADRLYANPGRLDFGAAPRLTMLSLMADTKADAKLRARRPEVSGSDDRLASSIRALLAQGFTVSISLPNRRIRERVEGLLRREAIAVGTTAGAVRVIAHDIVAGFVMPDANLALIAQTDAYPRASSPRRQREIDPTKITFSFKPGDYVVHESYGIARFEAIERREVDGIERDYMLLRYAGDDTLYTPMDQIGKLTRYVGPEGSEPKLTKLGGTQWTRATARAKKAAKLLAFDLVNLYARRSQVRGTAFDSDTERQAAMEAMFPFEETPDQIEAIADVKADMESDRPMDRLVIGDVGYGKTEVAIRAAFKAIQDGKQVMVLCPTTILAQQHFTNFSERFAPFSVRVEVLSRFRTPAQQKAALHGFATGEVALLIGTHRLLSADVMSADLGLLIIDEEQRFGVEHKEKLKNMREQIDVLALSATPIPRTLQMSLSGVRDMSVIDTPPAGRFPVEVHVGEWHDEIVAEAVTRELARGGQVYYVSNRVKTIDGAVQRVRDAAPDARIGVAHGQLSEHELEDVMERFAANEVDVLVATTIVESGIDNPHSNTLIIEDSQRLGLSQLYQLKGRVGRSHTKAFAYFLYPSDEGLTKQAVERLMAIAEHDELGSGIKIAMRDLEIRGAGSIIGGEQSGQLAAVGFDLFASMISEAVSNARGEDTVEAPEATLDILVPAYFPDEYIEDIFARVNYYRRIAAARTPEGVAAIREEIEREYGVAPEQAANLLDLAELRVRAQDLGIRAVSAREQTVTLRFYRMLDRVKDAAVGLGATVERRSPDIHWKAPYGKSVVRAALSLLDGIVGRD